jgi:hypothetical protein
MVIDIFDPAVETEALANVPLRARRIDLETALRIAQQIKFVAICRDAFLYGSS